MRPQRRAFLLRGKGEAEIACAAGDEQQSGDDGCHAKQRVIRTEQLFKRHAFLLAQRRGKYAVQNGAQHEEYGADPYPRTACRRQTAVNIKAVQQMQRAQTDTGDCERRCCQRQKLRFIHLVFPPVKSSFSCYHVQQAIPCSV